MTRETKVGLLIGLAVILLIGVIVSDHLSVQHSLGPGTNADVADFAAANQGVIGQQSQAGNPTPTLLLDHQLPPSIDSQGPTSQQGHIGPITAEQMRAQQTQPLPRAMALGDRSQGQGASQQQSPITQRLDRSSPVSVPDHRQTPLTQQLSQQFGQVMQRFEQVRVPSPARKTHTVVKGDNLFKIAAKFYGDGNKWKHIAKANPETVGTDGSVRAGVELVIPTLDGQQSTQALANTPVEIVRHQPGPLTTQQLQQVQRVTSTPRTVEVRDGDTLSTIAAEYLGSSKHWPKLFEANRDRLDSPDTLTIGQELRLPHIAD